ncbi:MAG: pilus assembly protein PilM [Coraliomargarita sp.]
MSSSKRLIINCGASRVTAAVLSSSEGSIHVDQLVTEYLEYDYSNEDAWQGAVRSALHSLTHEHKLSGKTTLLLPGSQVLTRPIRIPHVEEAKRAQTIAFEAQQNIPFGLHEVIWDSQVIEDDGVETEVLFVACKTEVIEDLCKSAEGAGLVIERINAAPLLDYNALQHSAGVEEETLVINIGASSTNLLFCNSDSFYIRNIPKLGGNMLTQSIADSVGKSFMQAEELKLKFFSGEIEAGEDDSGAKLLNSSADAFMRRMNQEITRSIVNYRRQKKGAAPKRIFLSGRGSLLSGLAEKLSESQKVKVELFDPVQAATLDGGIHEAMDLLRLQTGEIIGEASLDMVPSGAGVNLLPSDVQQEMEFSKKKPLLLVAALCLALAPLPAYLGMKSAAEDYRSVTRKLEAKTTPLTQRQAKIQANLEEAQKVAQSISMVEGLVNTKTNWIQFFAELQDILQKAQDVWIEDLAVNRAQKETGAPSYELVVSGMMLVREAANGPDNVDQTLLSERIRRLQASFESSRFVSEAKSPKIEWENLNNGLKVLPFEIVLIVDAAKPL